jgi:DNA-binding GntR family transcriptional regulator
MNPPASGPEALVRDIVAGLSDGRFATGQRLSEPDLMARYGVGRSTVREALGRLAAGGLVVHAPHRGAQIPHLTRRAARDVLKVAQSLLALAATQAAEAVAMGADPAPLLAAAQEYATDGRARARYYRALIGLCGNAELERLLPTLQIPLIRAQLGLGAQTGATERAALVHAIAAGQPEQARRAATAHLDALIAHVAALPGACFAAGEN